MTDIEKLIKKKLDIEAFEIEDERPRRAPPRRDETPRDERRSSEPARSERPTAPPPRRYTPPAAPVDPFFTQPYEAVAEVAPDWEKPANQAPAPSGLSRYIKARKKVASLLGGK